MRKRGAQLGHGWRDRENVLVAARASFDNAVVGPARNTRHFIVHEYRIHASDNGLELTVRRVLDAGVGRFVLRPKVLIKSAVDTALSFVVGLSANPPFGPTTHQWYQEPRSNHPNIRLKCNTSASSSSSPEQRASHASPSGFSAQKRDYHRQ
jgi:hypothetical protein